MTTDKDDSSPVIFDWQYGVNYYFPLFYKQIDAQLLEDIQGLWKLIFEYGYHREGLLTEGVYVEPNFLSAVIYVSRPFDQFVWSDQLRFWGEKFIMTISDLKRLRSLANFVTAPGCKGEPLFHNWKNNFFKIYSGGECYELSWCSQYLQLLSPNRVKMYRYVSWKQIDAHPNENAIFSWD
jgi:hypothetical protein